MSSELKSEILELKNKLKISKDYNERDRIKCILLHKEKNKSIEEIADVMYMHVDTIKSYIKSYNDNKKIKNDPRGGSKAKLNEKDAQELDKYLSKNTYLKAKDIAKYVKDKYNVDYTIAGMTDWLKNRDFKYKRPATIPGKLSAEKQKVFIEEYQALKANLATNEVIVFMDAVHPEYQSKRVCGWIKKGEVKHLQSTAKQTRLHLIGRD